MVPSMASRSQSQTEGRLGKERLGSLMEPWATSLRPSTLTSTERRATSNVSRIFSKRSPPFLHNRSIPSEIGEVGNPDIERLLRLDELRGIVQPCPFVKPLEHKLQAREELSRLRRPLSESNSEGGISVITIARRRGETIRILTGRASEEELDAIEEEEETQTGDFFKQLAGSSRAVSKNKLDEICKVSRKLTPSDCPTSTWLHYLQCYSKGQYNILHPPDPPEIGSKFKYLPAIAPMNEAQRMALCGHYDLLWPIWSNEKVVGLLRAAMSQFNTSFASFSIFNEKNEVFKAEKGYNQPELDRKISIAAHVLYTNEVLVLLDTQKDWRFQRNPLVSSGPCIRFFAGAPLLSTEGLVVGVFAVWAKEPRQLFSPDERRELAEFGALLMSDLNLQAEKLSERGPRETPILDRESLINGQYLSQSQDLSSMCTGGPTNFDSRLVPSALRYHRSTTPPESSDLHFGTLSQNATCVLNPTPPPSREKENPTTAIDSQTKSFPQRHGNSSKPKAHSSRHEMTSTVQGSRNSAQRPFSSSDLTSLHPHPPNTPDHSLDADDDDGDGDDDEDELSQKLNLDLTLEQFPSVPEISDFEDSGEFSISSHMKQSNYLRVSSLPETGTLRKTDDIAGSAKDTNSEHNPFVSSSSSDYDASISALSESPRRSQFGRRMSFDNASVKERTLSSSFPPLASPPRHRSRRSRNFRNSKVSIPRSENSRSSCGTISPLWELSEVAEEAALACSSFAQKMNYDLIYVADVRPLRPLMTDAELLKLGGLKLKILTAYGLNKPLELLPKTHLDTLRCKDTIEWKHPNPTQALAEGTFQWGCSVPIPLDDTVPLQFRDSGLVLGLLRRKEMTVDHESELLMEFSQTLKNIFWKNPSKKDAQRSMTDLASSATKSYLMNEETEVRRVRGQHTIKHSLDSQHLRRFI